MIWFIILGISPVIITIFCFWVYKRFIHSGEYHLRHAIKTGKVESVKLLLEKGVDVNFIIFNSPPLSVALELDHTDIAKLLLDKGADPNPDMGAPLVKALELGHTDIAKLLLDKGADPNQLKGAALNVALKKKYFGIIKMLINKGASSDDKTMALIEEHFESQGQQICDLCKDTYRKSGIGQNFIILSETIAIHRVSHNQTWTNTLRERCAETKVFVCEDCIDDYIKSVVSKKFFLKLNMGIDKQGAKQIILNCAASIKLCELYPKFFNKDLESKHISGFYLKYFREKRKFVPSLVKTESNPVVSVYPPVPDWKFEIIRKSKWQKIFHEKDQKSIDVKLMNELRLDMKERATEELQNIWEQREKLNPKHYMETYKVRHP